MQISTLKAFRKALQASITVMAKKVQAVDPQALETIQVHQKVLVGHVNSVDVPEAAKLLLFVSLISAMSGAVVRAAEGEGGE